MYYVMCACACLCAINRYVCIFVADWSPFSDKSNLSVHLSMIQSDEIGAKELLAIKLWDSNYFGANQFVKISPNSWSWTHQFVQCFCNEAIMFLRNMLCYATFRFVLFLAIRAIKFARIILCCQLFYGSSYVVVEESILCIFVW